MSRESHNKGQHIYFIETGSANICPRYKSQNYFRNYLFHFTSFSSLSLF